MLDSKNFLWLGSFFALLFITFCVTKHLDDLNPHITNVQNEHDLAQIEDTLVDLPDEKNLFVKDVIIENEADETKLPKEDEKNQSVELSQYTLHIEKADVTQSKDEKKQETKEPTQAIQQKEPIKTPTIQTPKQKIKAPKLVKTPTFKTIEKIILEDSEVYEILQNDKQNNKLNKIAYKYTINTNSHILIKAKDLQLANKLKEYLVTKNVEKPQIQIKTSSESESLVLILLKERI